MGDDPLSHCHCHLLDQLAKATLSIFFLVSLDQNGDPAEQAELQERTEHWPLARPTYTTRNYTDDARTSHQLHKVNTVASAFAF